jgi:hypothetical protein
MGKEVKLRRLRYKRRKNMIPNRSCTPAVEASKRWMS